MQSGLGTFTESRALLAATPRSRHRGHCRRLLLVPKLVQANVGRSQGRTRFRERQLKVATADPLRSRALPQSRSCGLPTQSLQLGARVQLRTGSQLLPAKGYD